MLCSCGEEVAELFTSLSGAPLREHEDLSPFSRQRIFSTGFLCSRHKEAASLPSPSTSPLASPLSSRLSLLASRSRLRLPPFQLRLGGKENTSTQIFLAVTYTSLCALDTAFLLTTNHPFLHPGSTTSRLLIDTTTGVDRFRTFTQSAQTCETSHYHGHAQTPGESLALGSLLAVSSEGVES
jgi:hypothetical protein